MNWLKILKTAVELIPVIGNILAVLGRKKAEDKAKKIENVATAIITGVEEYGEAKKLGGGVDIKKIIKKVAVSTGAQAKLDELVQKITKKT